MKKLNLEATDENILGVISEDSLGRTQDIIDFINLLEEIDSNVFIALDAAWGEGKTFFVRQIEMTLRYHNKQTFQMEISEDEQNAFTTNKALSGLVLKRTYLPIYFDAWLYDNHADALMALLFVMVKNCGKYIDTTIQSKISDKLVTIFDSIDFWEKGKWNNSNLKIGNIKNLKDMLIGKDIFTEVSLLEEVRTIIKQIFNDIIVESGEKLVIFIDELDRCKPTFAVEMLESIKHYFDDDRVIFVMSVNKSQLIHTISNYYGNAFDSSGYLNKFFDISIQLPVVDTTKYFQELDIQCDDSRDSIKLIANELQKIYKLSIRDATSYFQKINSIYKKVGGRYVNSTWYLMILFIPILCILDVKDITQKERFLKGIGFDIIENVASQSEFIKKYIVRIIKNSNNIIEYYDVAIQELKDIYEYVSLNELHRDWYEGALEIYPNFKQECIKACNKVV